METSDGNMQFVAGDIVTALALLWVRLISAGHCSFGAVRSNAWIDTIGRGFET